MLYSHCWYFVLIARIIQTYLGMIECMFYKKNDWASSYQVHNSY